MTDAELEPVARAICEVVVRQAEIHHGQIQARVDRWWELHLPQARAAIDAWNRRPSAQVAKKTELPDGY